MSAETPTTEQILGKFYRVPAVLVKEWRGYKGWLPVMGPKHTDAEVVGFPWAHFHIDWRFAPTRLLRRFRDWHLGIHLGMPVQCPDNRGNQVILEGPVLKLMKMKAEQDPFPRHRAKWIKELESQFACVKLKNGVCPHRGIPVSAMFRVGDTLTCPGHGLRWNANTGELVRDE